MRQALHQPQASEPLTRSEGALKIGILIVAYNAATTLAQVLDRVPETFRPRISQVFVCDDASQDSTYLVGLHYQQTNDDLPLTVIRHPENLGYGGNQKAGYRLALEYGLDIIVLLHGDGQYAPECLEEVVAPLERGDCDAVLGSRMLVKGEARRGGMPLYKHVGNQVLTRFENRMLGTHLSEFHSGYRGYSVKALSSIPFERNSDGFNFDTQIIIQLVHAGKRIVEIPIPTYYGDEICHVDGLKYAKDVSADVLRYRLAQVGFSSGDLGGVGEEYSLKESVDSSHATIVQWLDDMPRGRVLDLGCSSGLLSARVRGLGYEVTGVDSLELEGIRQRVDRFVQADLDAGLPESVTEAGPYDVVLAADVLEHVRYPERLLDDIREVLVSGGTLLVSVPNFGHWYARGRTALGLFDYDQRGILDNGHVRFFMRRGLRRRLAQAGYSIAREHATGLPFEVLSGRQRGMSRAVRAIDAMAVKSRPTLFGYQFVCQCEAPSTPEVVDRENGD